jgi:hypothetical protein
MKEVLSEFRRVREVMGLINEDTHPTIYSDYTFNEINILNGQVPLVFFNGSKNINDEINKYIYCYDDDNCAPKIRITDGEENFEFPQWDSFGRDILKKSKNGDLYINLTNFKKFYPDYSFDKQKIKISDIVSSIKKRYNFARNIVRMLKEIYEGEKTSEGKPMYGIGSDENCVTNEGVINYRGVKYGLNNALISNWSILNYFNTNSLVITYLLKLYFDSENKSLKDFNENFNSSEKNFLNWLERNKESLFSPSSSHLDELEKLNLSTLKRGIAREQDAVKITMKLHGVGEGSITEYCPGSVEDTVNGRDFRVSLGTESYYYQSKPLTGEIKEENGKYLIYTNSMKPYGKTVDRLIFLNDKGKFYIFDNKDYEVLNRGEMVKFSNPPISKG